MKQFGILQLCVASRAGLVLLFKSAANFGMLVFKVYLVYVCFSKCHAIGNTMLLVSIAGFLCTPYALSLYQVGPLLLYVFSATM
jgi:hypothetical protein